LAESVSFDRAAGYYDRTRALSESAMERLVPMLVAELKGAGRVLEVGVGTGRFALPLAREGVRVSGIDIAPEMLRRLKENSGGVGVPVAVADATHLPFPERSFGGAIAAHVLHLIPAWPLAVSELFRVVRPGGVLLATRGSRTDGDWWNAVRRRFMAEAGDPAWPPGLDGIKELDELVSSRGAVARSLPEVSERSAATVNDLLRMLEDGIWSVCWSLDHETRRRAAAAARAWAVEHVGNLDEERPLAEVQMWRAYDLP
jgi:ubiquinone/menaquinone biosynthesis C-methylase UbiE